MSKIATAIKLGPMLIAGSLLFSLSDANACTTAAWTAPDVGAPTAGGPDNDVSRYSGLCGLQANLPGPSYVKESVAHATEGGSTPFQARFFVHTGVSAGSPVVFRAVDGASNSVIDVAYNATTQNFTFTPAGASAASTATNSAPRDRWVEVRLAYQAGQPFNASTTYLDTVSSIAATGNVGAATIDEVRMGVVAANGAVASNGLFFDEYEASRAAIGAAAFAPMCRGDANASGEYDLADIFAVVDEFLRNQGDLARPRAPGQPHYTGTVAVVLGDIFGVVDEFLALQGGAPGSGCPQ
jgi:hypothetical protein